MFFNVLMLISGVGLIRLREWGRKLAVWVAALKIVRLIVLYGIFIMVMVPIFVKLILDMFEEMAQSLPPGAGRPPIAGMTTMFGTMFSVSAVAVMILGSIYPGIVLWLLTRPGVKAACNGRESLLEEA
jgi:hypothetical protein